MAKRRKVNNLLALAILSAVSQQPMHPYEMASSLREWGKDQDMKIKWGSLYTVVQNLEKHGLLEAAESVRRGRRPERTVYRITGAGRDELTDWVRELVSTPERELPRFKAALSVLGVLPPDEASSLLAQRLTRLDEETARQRATLTRLGREIPRLFLLEVEYDLALRDAESAWIRSLLDELTTGSLQGLTEWRDWHRTGRTPDDWSALAKGGGTPATDRD